MNKNTNYLAYYHNEFTTCSKFSIFPLNFIFFNYSFNVDYIFS